MNLIWMFYKYSADCNCDWQTNHFSVMKRQLWEKQTNWYSDLQLLLSFRASQITWDPCAFPAPGPPPIPLTPVGIFNTKTSSKSAESPLIFGLNYKNYIQRPIFKVTHVNTITLEHQLFIKISDLLFFWLIWDAIFLFLTNNHTGNEQDLYPSPSWGFMLSIDWLSTHGPQPIGSGSPSSESDW